MAGEDEKKRSDEAKKKALIAYIMEMKKQIIERIEELRRS
jgi:hypothetical protein